MLCYEAEMPPRQQRLLEITPPVGIERDIVGRLHSALFRQRIGRERLVSLPRGRPERRIGKRIAVTPGLRENEIRKRSTMVPLDRAQDARGRQGVGISQGRIRRPEHAGVVRAAECAIERRGDGLALP